MGSRGEAGLPLGDTASLCCKDEIIFRVTEILSRKEGSKLRGKHWLESSVFRNEPMTLCRRTEVSFAASVLHMLVGVFLLVDWLGGLAAGVMYAQ